MRVTGGKRASYVGGMAIASLAMLVLGGCAGGLPDVHSITSLSFGGSSAPEKPKTDQPVNAAEIIQPGALGDVAIGKSNAPVTIVQYVSLTCANCSSFQTDTLPKIKKTYIDKGKVRLILREFPDDTVSLTAALAARCVPANDFFKVVEKILVHQKDWTGPEAKKDALYNLVKFTGVKRDKFDACLANQSTNEALVLVKDRGKSYGVTVSPTFFVNGKKVTGAVSFEEIQGVIEVALATPATPPAAAQAPAAQQLQQPKQASAKST
jgi:protein-disulfide isomerase